jgi:uncharacterized tellurite resistance protein B-like protein
MGEDSESFTFEELRTAFELRIVHMIMTADEVVDPRELQFLEAHFSGRWFRSVGFVDPVDGSFTQRFTRAIEIAPRTLAGRLSQDQKSKLLRFFCEACHADGSADPRELSVVVQAARMLRFSHPDAVVELSRSVAAERNAHGDAPLWAPLEATRPVHGEPESEDPAQGEPLTEVDGSSVRDDEPRWSRPHGSSTTSRTALMVISDADVREPRFDAVENVLFEALDGGRLLSLAGELRFVFESWPDLAEPPDRDPDLRAWLSRLALRYPWLPPWLASGDAVAGSLVSAALPCDETDPNYPIHFVTATVQVANYAVAWTHRIGGHELDHVYDFLAQFEITDIPPGYFEGVDAMADELDSLGRHWGANWI